MNGIKKYTGLFVIYGFLLVHLCIINAYGLTWDFHFHFFGGGHLLGYSWQQLEPRALPYTEPDPRRAWSLPYGPLMSIPPVASFVYVYKTMHLLPADSAYHLPIIFWGVAGIGILYFFVKEAIDARTALFAALFLALTPRYFGDLHNNMKDIPSAVVFALNIWLLWRLIIRKRVIDLFAAILGFAVAFNVKINSIFIPVVFIAWLFLTRGDMLFRNSVMALAKWLRWSKKSTDPDRVRPTTHRLATWSNMFLVYFFLAPIAAFLLWWFFWPNPIFQLDHAYRTFGVGTNNIEVLLNGKWYCSGETVPWFYPFWYLAITTPLPILLFCLISLGSIIKSIITKSVKPIELLLLCWLFIPLTRYLSIHTGVIDGVRHFEEVLIPIAALSAISFSKLLVILSRHVRSMRIALIIGVFCWLSWNIIAYHPYQISYFNELVGGARGAFGKYDLDYWGTSQKAAVLWVNEHAPQNAKIHIVMAANVAATYLRPDLLQNLNKYGYDQSDFVIFLNRQSFYYRFFYSYEYLLVHKPIHTIEIQGAPLTWIFDNRSSNVIPKQTPWWQTEDPCILQYWKK